MATPRATTSNKQAQQLPLKAVRGSTAKIFKWMLQNQILMHSASKAPLSSGEMPTDAGLIRIDVMAAQTFSKLSDAEKSTIIDSTSEAIRKVIDKLLNSKERTSQSIGTQCAQELGSYKETIDEINQGYDKLKGSYKEIKARIQDLIKIDAQISRLSGKTVNEAAASEIKTLQDQRKELLDVLKERSGALQEDSANYLFGRATLSSKLNRIYQTGVAHVSEEERIEIQTSVAPDVIRPR